MRRHGGAPRAADAHRPGQGPSPVRRGGGQGDYCGGPGGAGTPGRVAFGCCSFAHWISGAVLIVLRISTFEPVTCGSMSSASATPGGASLANRGSAVLIASAIALALVRNSSAALPSGQTAVRSSSTSVATFMDADTPSTFSSDLA